MAASLSLLPKSPMPADVDERAEAFKQLEDEVAKAQLELSTKRRELAAKESALIDLVKSFGGPHATKSKILHGIVWEMVATFAQYSTLDSAAVERFRLALIKAKKTRLLKKIFTSDTRWNFAAGAGEILKAEASQLSPKLMGLILQCTVTADKKPALDVRQKKKPNN